MDAIEIAREEPCGAAQCTTNEIEIEPRRARKLVVKNHGRDCGSKTEGRGKQCLGYAGSDNGQIRRL
jgi:hypothetical protein